MSNQMQNRHLCEKDKCTGCYACANCCPKEAIEMRADKDGAIRPFTDTEKCVNCGLCTKVCPVINKVDLKAASKVYAAYADEDIRSKSASGGIATALSIKFVENGGVVYGASNTHGLNIEHIRVDRVDNLKKLQGTKYVQSRIGNTYKRISADLNTGQKVLFIGTPCQVAALRNFIKNDTNLFCIDLVCHGVPVGRTLAECMSREGGIDSFDDKTITFRDEDGFSIKIRDKNNKVLYIGNLKNSYYYNGFIEGYVYRDNCYSCRYACKERAGDITLGDFWGLDNSCLDGDLKKGINAVLLNTSKGIDLFDTVIGDLSVAERTLEEAVAGNGQLRHSSKDSTNHRIFSFLVRHMSADNAVILCNIKKSVKLKAREIIKDRGLSKVITIIFPRLEKRL